MPRIAQVDEKGAGRIVEDIESGFLRYVPEMALSIVAVKTVGQTARLADIDLVQAVDAACRVETRSPVRGPLGELVVKRRNAGERGAGDVAEPRLRAEGERLFDGFEKGGRAVIPYQLPDADAVLEPPRVPAANVISNQVARQRVKCRAADHAKRSAPLFPSGDGLATEIENGGGDVGSDAAITGRRGRRAATAGSQRRVAGGQCGGEA